MDQTCHREAEEESVIHIKLHKTVKLPRNINLTFGNHSEVQLN